MKKINIAYWICTVIFAALMTLSSIPDVLMSPDAVKFIADLGYPRYFIPFIGVAKLLGVLAIMMPGYPRIRNGLMPVSLSISWELHIPWPRLVLRSQAGLLCWFGSLSLLLPTSFIIKGIG